jgi:hypothetical protein
MISETVNEREPFLCQEPARLFGSVPSLAGFGEKHHVMLVENEA